MTDIKAMARRIGVEFGAHRVLLFGSHADGTPTDDSDVDLLVVMPFKGNRTDQSVAMRLKLKPSFPVDLLVRTPEEIQKRIDMGDTFICDILKQGTVLYEADHG